MGKKAYHGNSMDEVDGAGAAPTMHPYSKETHEEGNMGCASGGKEGYEPTHVIHKGHGGIPGAGVDGHHKK